MGVGMVLLDQRLVARLQPHRGQRRLEIEHCNRLRPGRRGAHRRLAGVTSGMTIGAAFGMTAGMAIGAAPVAVMLLAGIKPEGIAHPWDRAMALAELPARPLP